VYVKLTPYCIILLRRSTGQDSLSQRTPGKTYHTRVAQTERDFGISTEWLCTAVADTLELTALLVESSIKNN